ncbi:hypothetical protein ABW21_db0206669 [Orbilia brochopaga]|nr:hypothetical protein ABW21_db0206669 [Drechslerella brochopaga]
MSSSTITTAKLRETLAKAPRNSAYARHIQKCLQYVDYYGGSAPVASKGKTERDLLEEDFQFLRDEKDGQHAEGTAEEIAKKYYDNLFREFALIDLSRWRDGQVALRWRTKQEVLQGLGQFTCASLTCPRHMPPSDEIQELDLDAHRGDDERNVKLETFEMNFGYVEKEVKKNALVKVTTGIVIVTGTGTKIESEGGAKREETTVMIGIESVGEIKTTKRRTPRGQDIEVGGMKREPAIETDIDMTAEKADITVHLDTRDGPDRGLLDEIRANINHVLRRRGLRAAIAFVA